MQLLRAFLTSKATLKTASWRVIALVTTIIIVWATTGSIEIAASIGGIDAILKTIFYWLHEKAWDSPRESCPCSCNKAE
jgi:uncharacterized membrane protein